MDNDKDTKPTEEATRSETQEDKSHQFLNLESEHEAKAQRLAQLKRELKSLFKSQRLEREQRLYNYDTEEAKRVMQQIIGDIYGDAEPMTEEQVNEKIELLNISEVNRLAIKDNNDLKALLNKFGIKVDDEEDEDEEEGKEKIKDIKEEDKSKINSKEKAANLDNFISDLEKDNEKTENKIQSEGITENKNAESSLNKKDDNTKETVKEEDKKDLKAIKEANAQNEATADGVKQNNAPEVVKSDEQQKAEPATNLTAKDNPNLNHLNNDKVYTLKSNSKDTNIKSNSPNKKIKTGNNTESKVQVKAGIGNLDKEFERTVKSIQCIKTSNDKWILAKYALFKQATEGDNETESPTYLDFVGREKWEEWNKYKGMSKFDAKMEFIKLVNNDLPMKKEKFKFAEI